MNTTTRTHSTVHPGLILGTALLASLLLYFVDEGRYSLDGLCTTGNIIAMGIYFIGLMLGSFLMAALFAKRPAGTVRTVLVLGLGTVVGFAFGLLFIAGIGMLQAI